MEKGVGGGAAYGPCNRGDKRRSGGGTAGGREGDDDRKMEGKRQWRCKRKRYYDNDNFLGIETAATMLGRRYCSGDDFRGELS